MAAWPLGERGDLSWRLSEEWVFRNEETGEVLSGADVFFNGKEIDWARIDERREAERHGDTGDDDDEPIPF